MLLDFFHFDDLGWKGRVFSLLHYIITAHLLMDGSQLYPDGVSTEGRAGRRPGALSINICLIKI